MAKGRNRLKQPAVDTGKHIKPKSTAGGSTQHEKVRLSFEHFNPECVGRCTLEQIGRWTDRLKRLCCMTWQEVVQSQRHKMGSEVIPRDQLKFPIPQQLTDDTRFLAFRSAGFMPMIAFREQAVLHVLWVSHDHSEY